MAENHGRLEGLEYGARWVRTSDDLVIWDAELRKGPDTLGWPSGRFNISSGDDAFVSNMVRIAVEAHIQAALACLPSRNL